MSEPISRRAPLWLILSVIVNMALIGFVAGFLIRGDKGGQPDRPHAERDYDRPDRFSGTRDRAVVRELMRDIAQEARTERGDRSAAAKVLAETLLADPYSVDAAQEALVAFRSGEQGMRGEADRLLAERMATLTPDQRRIVVDVLSRERGPRRGRRGDRRPR